MALIHCRCGGTHTSKEEWLHCEYLRAQVSQKAPVQYWTEDSRQMEFDFVGGENARD